MVLGSIEQPLSLLGRRPNPRCLLGYEWDILHAEQDQNIHVVAEKYRHFLEAYDPSLHTESSFSDVFPQALKFLL